MGRDLNPRWPPLPLSLRSTGYVSFPWLSLALSLWMVSSGCKRSTHTVCKPTSIEGSSQRQFGAVRLLPNQIFDRAGVHISRGRGKGKCLLFLAGVYVDEVGYVHTYFVRRIPSSAIRPEGYVEKVKDPECYPLQSLSRFDSQCKAEGRETSKCRFTSTLQESSAV